MANETEAPKGSNQSGTKKDSPSITVKNLARILNLTETRIQQLSKEGVIIKVARGRYDQWASISKYIAYLQDRRTNQWDAKDEEQTDLKREQLRRTKEEADRLELSNARTRGELVEVRKVKLEGEKIMGAIRNRILNSLLTDDEKDQCLRDILSLKDVDFSGE